MICYLKKNVILFVIYISYIELEIINYDIIQLYYKKTTTKILRNII
jgi:hypothetical protein